MAIRIRGLFPYWGNYYCYFAKWIKCQIVFRIFVYVYASDAHGHDQLGFFLQLVEASVYLHP